MFTKALEATLNQAFMQAREKRHEFITVEHLLFALLDNAEVSTTLVACGANLDRLRAGLGIFIDETTPHIPLNAQRDIQPTLSFQRVLQRAIYQVQSTGGQDVSGNHALIALFGEADSQAVYFLSQENISRIDVINYTTQGIAKPHREAEKNHFMSDMNTPSSDLNLSHESVSEENLIETYAANLNELALAGKLNPVIGREAELERTLQILCRRSKNNPLFVGEAGVGKTAIAEGLAQRIVSGNVPGMLAYSTVYSLDLGMLLAGTKYRGDFEKRFKIVLKALSRQTGSIVFIDEIHNLVGAGSATGGTMDASNLIKPLLSSGELRCMGATTYEEYRNFFSKDHALLRRFQKIDISEPNVEQTIKILAGLKSRFEKYHQIQYTEAGLQRAVELAARYMTDRHLPDKAIDVIDEAGAFQRLQPVNKQQKIIDLPEIEAVVAKMANIPIHHLSGSDKRKLKNLALRLKKMVFGQNQAVALLSEAIKLSRSGLRDLNKPMGSFLLTGPTGVGKTEITRQLAKELGIGLIRFDMSEYMERHTVSRLIGAPPGYVGFDQGGLLTEAVIKQPYSVLLLDEIEKAHPDLFNILLQVMDYGHLTDNNGRKADFRHVIIIMTTNVGASRLERHSMGFQEQDHAQDTFEEIKQLFSPEFRNRLDAVIPFHYLETETVLKIVEKNIKQLCKQMADKNIILNISNAAKQWLAKEGYDRKMGARPMERLIEEQLKKPLAEELLFGCFSNSGGEVQVNLENGHLQIQAAARAAIPISPPQQPALTEDSD
jgi:ATP-dependent Clp protease ATP-binding subunit ClpA